jgi:hypothetical protein
MTPRDRDRFSRRVFKGAAIWGVLALSPLFFLEPALGRAAPPPMNHPENYYGFLCVALGWQWVIFLIGTDVRKYQAFIVPVIAAKFSFAMAMLALWAIGRVDEIALLPAVAELVLGSLFLATRSGRRGPAPGAVSRAG